VFIGDVACLSAPTNIKQYVRLLMFIKYDHQLTDEHNVCSSAYIGFLSVFWPMNITNFPVVHGFIIGYF
jgi:hypothetical protein